MKPPIRFPGDTEVMLEDAARFRAQSPAERMRTIRSVLADGAFLMRRASNAERARQYSEELEALARRNVREFIARHAR